MRACLCLYSDRRQFFTATDRDHRSGRWCWWSRSYGSHCRDLLRRPLQVEVRDTYLRNRSNYEMLLGQVAAATWIITDNVEKAMHFG